MDKSIKLSQIVLLLIFTCFIEPGSSIKCWSCRSDSDPKCADPFDNTTVPIIDCNQEASPLHLEGVKSTLCRKIRQKVNGEWRYFRHCAFLGEPGIEGDERFCLMRTGTYNVFMEYCTCNSKDGCNTATSNQVHWLTFFFLTCALIVGRVSF
ncbi:uncharacterized protein LOC122500704 [Leptopilina heterotoma]|uniref:uncharacterized protein LOC122500704 n=1 Tax=Leptopilina heterotoma TaxID=63436 RepID=UPI001CAA406F|nr:uncharacterized protein LOC122500704 [Leptopilina heterotoma]